MRKTEPHAGLHYNNAYEEGRVLPSLKVDGYSGVQRNVCMVLFKACDQTYLQPAPSVRCVLSESPEWHQGRHSGLRLLSLLAVQIALTCLCETTAPYWMWTDMCKTWHMFWDKIKQVTHSNAVKPKWVKTNSFNLSKIQNWPNRDLFYYNCRWVITAYIDCFDQNRLQSVVWTCISSTAGLLQLLQVPNSFYSPPSSKHRPNPTPFAAKWSKAIKLGSWQNVTVISRSTSYRFCE